MLTLIIILVLSLPFVNAQESRQKFEGLQIPDPGNSNISLNSKINNVPLNSQLVEVISRVTNPLATFTVTTTADYGVGSFRDAITKANETNGLDIINFNIPGTGIQTLAPLTPLPDIIYPVIIDGTTQAGYSNKPLIEIDGIWASPGDGIVIRAAGCTVKGIAVNRFNGRGVVLYFGQNIIEGCFLGLDPNGTTNKGNLEEGLLVLSANNSIGNPNGMRNVISGNDSSGIVIALSNATGNKIQNTYIGTDFNGATAVPNKLNGITIFQSPQCTIGGSSFDEMNVISGNLGNGIRIEGGQSQQITIKGNRIGTTANGSLALGNLFSGISVIYGTGSATGNPSNIIIGGKWTESQNLISGNTGAGVAFFLDAKGGGTGNIVAGNLIGTDYNGTNKIPNTHGIFIIRDDTTGSMPGVKIGGSISDSNNVISGNNAYGIWIKSNGARNNLIYGNYIGTTRSVTVGQIFPLGNGFAGVYIDSASFNRIGEINPYQGNVIGDNGRGGISIIGIPANGNTIYNNFIGTYLLVPQGVNLGNRTNGIFIEEASGTKVGGPGLMNEIANNYSKGIYVYSGIKNVLYGNSIYKNGTIGIDLEPEYITKNDSGDIDFGPNNLQNFPILDSVNLMPDKIIIHSTFYSKPNTQYTLHFFRSDQKSPSHFGEGQFYLDSVSVTTNDSGWAFLHTTINKVVSDDQFITALAVDADGNTSEFSRAFCLKDSDGDDIYDCWESQGDGIDVNADGLIDLDLYSRGARPDHKDIFVEADYMNGSEPLDVSIKMVKDAFAEISNEFLNNPDGLPGIKLHVEFNDTALTNELLPANPWPRFFELKRAHFGTAMERQHPNAKYILEAKKLVYRYCIWANRYGNTSASGQGELGGGAGGNDLLITLGSWSAMGDSDKQAGTFMHELGHTLGLRHGGIDDIHYKPNYYSVMNYAWQYPQKNLGTHLTWRLVYSNAALPTLDENNLNEAVGMNPPPRYYPDPILFPHNIGTTDTVIKIDTLYPNVAVDWDGNGDASGFANRPVDINFLDPAYGPSPGETLVGHADLPNLKFNFRNSPDFRDPAPGLEYEKTYTLLDEMTLEIYNLLQALPPYGVVPPVMVQASFKWLGTLGGNRSVANGISDNRQVIVGQARDSSYSPVAFRWTATTGMQSLGDFGRYYGELYSEATGISADGSIIVGWSIDSTNVKRAFKWTEATGMQDLGIGEWSKALAISGDGSTIVGESFEGGNIKAFRHKDGAVQYLGTLGGNSASATAVSYNGSVIVGYSSTAANHPYAFRWIEDPLGGTGSVMVNIGTYYSFARGVSDNGNTVTGSETGSAGRHRAFRWSVNDGMQLNIVGDFSEGTDVTFDGKYLVGYAGDGAFRFSNTGQLDLYNEILADSLATGSDLWGIRSITSDGRFGVGEGYNSSTGRDEAFLLDTGGRLITSIEYPKQIIINNTYSLGQNYPNPFNPVTTIRYNIPNAAQVSISIFNILGQKVTTLVDDFKYAGSYEVKFDASRLASGIYLYNIQAGKYFETKKMILLK
jgi:probable HAF family extracellular repeat protein